MVPGSLRDLGTANTLMLDFWPPELRENEFLEPVKTPVYGSRGNQCMLYNALFVHEAQAYGF